MPHRSLALYMHVFINPNFIEILYDYKPEITSFYALNQFYLTLVFLQDIMTKLVLVERKFLKISNYIESCQIVSYSVVFRHCNAI